MKLHCGINRNVTKLSAKNENCRDVDNNSLPRWDSHPSGNVSYQSDVNKNKQKYSTLVVSTPWKEPNFRRSSIESFRKCFFFIRLLFNI